MIKNFLIKTFQNALIAYLAEAAPRIAVTMNTVMESHGDWLTLVLATKSINHDFNYILRRSLSTLYDRNEIVKTT